MMCQACVEDATITAWLYGDVEEFAIRYPDSRWDGCHIVIDDCNVKDSHIMFCLMQDGPNKTPWRTFLGWMLTVPLAERCGR